MDLGSLVSAVITLALGAVGALGWLFKLHGEVRVLREKLHGEVELRKALEARVNGIEERIFDELLAIRQMLHGLAAAR